MAERPRRRNEGVTIGITSKCRKRYIQKSRNVTTI